LQGGLATVNRDVSYLRNQAKNNIKRYIDERLPEEYEKCLIGLTAITKEAWIASQNTGDKREKIQALSLAKECWICLQMLLWWMMRLGLSLVDSRRTSSHLVKAIKKNQMSLTIMNTKIS
jgi:hypothetical protein